MAATEDISLRIALDDRQAQAGLDSLRQETSALAASAEGAAGGIGAITTKVDRAKAVIEPTATAVNGMASAFGGLNTQTGAVLGGVSNLASAFMAGGPLALGLVTIGTGISWLTTKYAETTKAAQEAEKAQKDAAMATAKRIQSLTQGLEGRISGALGADQAAIEMGKLQTNVAFAQEELDRLQTQAGRSEFMAFEAANKRTTGSVKAYEQAVLDAKQRLSDLDLELANAEQAYREYSSSLDVANRLEARRKQIDEESIEALKAKTKATKEQADADFDGVKAVQELFAAEIQARKEAEAEARRVWEQTGPTREMFDREQLRQTEELERARLDAAKRAADERIRIEEEVARRTQEINEKTASVSVDIASGAVGLLVGAANEIVTGAFAGKENIVEMATANFLAGIGNQLVGIGTKALIEGAIISANPLTPGAGAPMMLLGAGAIAAGIGMGAAGAGISASIANTASAGGGGGAAATSTPMGAGRISTGGTGERGGGGMEQVTYVFNAPVFGDQNRSARHVAALQRHAQRNLLLA